MKHDVAVYVYVDLCLSCWMGQDNCQRPYRVGILYFEFNFIGTIFVFSTNCIICCIDVHCAYHVWWSFRYAQSTLHRCTNRCNIRMMTNMKIRRNLSRCRAHMKWWGSFYCSYMMMMMMINTMMSLRWRSSFIVLRRIWIFFSYLSDLTITNGISAHTTGWCWIRKYISIVYVCAQKYSWLFTVHL